ncbi:Venom allergen 3 [Eumeta japonica]|uniref:Venom allergen 3 n=1 Tax=Eumeta variegata TaxID=151549 RepID=A0A4C1UN99_EUMVA|nr:Venom allergen 3 [Eumeta japonica]
MLSLVLFVAIGLATTEGDCGVGKRIMRSGQLSAYEKQAIVDAHNRLRQSVALGHVSRQPPAANMMEMVWDDELAATAQRWADQCRPQHDRAAQRDVGRFPVGQNIAATWTTRPPSEPQDSTPDFQKQIDAWFDEVSLYGFRPTTTGHGTGHYSQLVWGETTHVGCGFTFYYDPARGYTKLYVCNYGPGGNVIGAPPYEKGYPSCSNYGFADSVKYNGLCSTSYAAKSYNADARGSFSNVIPDSTGDSQYNYQYSNQFSNQFANQYQYQYQYNQPSTITYYDSQPQTSTLRPLLNLFNTATNFLNKPKSTAFSSGSAFDLDNDLYLESGPVENMHNSPSTPCA